MNSAFKKILSLSKVFFFIALALSLTVISFDVHAAATVITPSDLNWGFVTEGGTGSGAYSTGPAPHTGSAKLITNGSADGVVYGGLITGFPLSGVTVLKYDAYRASGPANVVPNINLEIDFDSTDAFDGTSVYQGRLVFIPGGTINEDTWYTFDALAGTGVWYTSPASLDAATTNYCTLGVTSGCTWAQLLSYWPNMNLLSSWADEYGAPGTGMAGFKAGSGWGTPFEGYVDNFVINATTYNFEPSIPPVYNVTQDTYHLTIPDAVAAANPGDTINVSAGTYVLSSQLDLNKANLTLNGAGSGSSIIQVSGTGYRFNITAAGVTINGFSIQKTDKVGVQNIIYVGANNVSITNNEIWGQYVYGDGDVSRAMEFPGGLSGLNISGNTIHNLRQPGYINGVSTGTISNNYVYLTRGWVVAGGNLTFTNNTWGSGANANIYDIVLLSSVSASHYTDVPAVSAANNNAVIEDQRTVPATLSVVYVDGSVAVSGTGTAASPKKTITEGIARVVNGGTVHVLAGTYAEDLVIDKSLALLGPNTSINPNTGSRVAEAVVHPSTSNPNPAVCTNMVYMETSGITIKGFTFDGDNPGLTSGLIINGADVDACEILAGYEGMGDITVENNILEHASYAGIDFYNYTNSSATTNNYIRYNRFEDIGTSTYGYGMGILIYNNFYAEITDNVMTGVRVGIQTGNYSQANPGTTNSISNNQISSWRLGLFHNLWYSSASPLTISNNAFTAENYTGAVNYSGILLSSMGTTVSATVTGNTITILGTDTHSGYTAGYNIWNVQNTAPITISGGTLTGGDYGVFVNNWEGYSSDAGNTFITVDGLTILDSDIAGIYVKDSDSNTNGATVYADVQNSTIDTNATGILVYGLQATAKANYNNLSGNPTEGITNSNTTFTMDGTLNWWGTQTGPGPVGPGTGSNVSTFVDYDPWCYNVACSQSGPYPWVGASAQNGWIQAHDWPLGVDVDLFINSVYIETKTIGIAPWDPNHYMVEFTHVLSVGDEVMITGWGKTKTLIVSSHVVTDIDALTNTVSGTSTAGTTVEVCANVPAGCVQRLVDPVGGTGTWTVDFTPEYTLTGGSNGWTAEWDADGDATWYDWNIPNPVITASAQNDWIVAREWALGVDVTLYINGDLIETKTIGVLPWGQNGVQFDHAVSVNDVITISGAGLSKTLTVTSHAVTGFDLGANTLSGESMAGALVEVCANVPAGCVQRLVDPVGVGGTWTVDFDPDFTLEMGSNGWAAEWDADGDATWYDWNIPNPSFQVQPDHGWVGGFNDWTVGNTVTLIVDDTPIPSTPYLYSDSQTIVAGGPMFMFNVAPFFDLQVGQYVFVSDGVFSKSTQITEVHFDSLNETTDVAAGTGPANAEYQLYIRNKITDTGTPLFMIDGSGNWTVDLTPFISTQYVQDANIQVLDSDGDATVAHLSEPVWNETQLLAYQTIQSAINDAVNGDTIFISPGTYAENVIVNKSVTLYGAGVDTIVMPAVSNPVCGGGSLCGGAASNVFLVQANNVVIHDLTVDGDNPSLTSGVVRGGADLDARNGIIKNTNATYNNLEVYNVTMENIYLRGIYSTGGSFNFHDNTVTNVQGEYASIAIFAWGGPGIIENNTVSYANDAIAANHSNGIQFLNNIVTNSSSGIHTDNSGDGGGVADLIQGNNVSCTGVSGAYGIFVFVPYLAPTVDNNTVTNCDVGLSVWGGGAAVTSLFTNNTVTGNYAAGGVGVYLTTSMAGYGYSDVYADFSNNTITGYETGVYLDANQQSWETGPYVAKTITAAFELNRIYGNTTGADKNTTGTYVADFVHNWWGAISGPSGAGTGTGNPIGAGLNYIQWCGDSACTFFEPVALGMPVGSLTTWDKYFNWTGVSAATHYIVEIQTSTGTPIESTWASASTYCSGITCTIKPAWNLPNGDYRWRVSDYSPVYGYGAYSNWQYFTLNLSVVTPGAPSGTLTSWDKSFNWTGYSGPTHYLIEVQTSAGAPVESTWALASSACSGTTCQLYPGWNLPNGDYRWRIRTYGATGYGPYTAWQNFTLGVPVVTLGAPSGTLTSWNQSFSWTGFSGPTHYLIELQTSAGTPLDSTWVLASSACSGTACQKNPGWSLPNGDYRWRIRTYGATGYGPYSAWQNFTLNIGVVVLGAPSGTLTSWDKSFSWTGFSGPTHYLIEVQTSTGAYVDSTWALASSVCSGTSCQATPAFIMPNGNYRWRIRPYSTVTGYGSYTAWQSFTLNLP